MKFFSRRAQFAAVCVLSTVTLLSQATKTLADRTAMPYHTPQEKKAYEKRSREFGRLWLARRKSNITPQLLQMLNKEPTPGLRQAIVIALGRIENPQAVKPLHDLLVKANAQQPGRIKSPAMISLRDDIPPFRIKLALGRIRARDLKGTAKLNAIAKTVGTDWTGILRKAQRLRTQFKSKRTLYQAQKSDDRQIVEEFYNVLYRMGKAGENIEKIGADKLILWPQHAPIVKWSSLSEQDEAEAWLRRATPPNQTGFAAGHLLDLGPTVPDAILRHLKNILRLAKAKPQIMKQTSAYTSIFDAAIATDDRRFIPILQQFQQVDDRWTKTYARRAVKQLQAHEGLAAVKFP